MPNFVLEKPSPLLTHVGWSKTVSTAYADGQLVQADDDSSGVGFDVADATSTLHIGIVRQTIAATDSDYASTTRLNLEVDLFGEYRATVGTGTITASHEGYFADLDSNGKVDVGNSSINVFLIRKADVTNAEAIGYITKWAYIF